MLAAQVLSSKLSSKAARLGMDGGFWAPGRLGIAQLACLLWQRQQVLTAAVTERMQ